VDLLAGRGGLRRMTRAFLEAMVALGLEEGGRFLAYE